MSALFILSGCVTQDNVGFVTINNQVIKVEIADDPQERYQGLSGRESMAENEGMLFVFEEPGIYTFVMREMNFPLDIIWIKDNKIVDISHNLPAPEQGGAVAKASPISAVNYVLEVNGGFAEKRGVSVGDTVEMN